MNTPPGRYDDGSGRQRLWDGQQWGAFAEEPRSPATESLPARQKFAVLAVIAIVLSVGSILCLFYPPTRILGVIGAVVALALGIIVVSAKSSRTKTAFGALGMSLAATLIASQAVMSIVSDALDRDSAESSDTAVSTRSGDEFVAGTREEPGAIGSEISNDEWTVVIDSVDPGADAFIQEKDRFTPPAPTGSHYEIVNYSVTYLGDHRMLAGRVDVEVLLSSGATAQSYVSPVVLSDSFDRVKELHHGDSVTGSVVFIVPDDEKYVFRVVAGFEADEVFIEP